MTDLLPRIAEAGTSAAAGVRLWLLLGSGAPLTPEAGAEKLAGLRARFGPAVGPEAWPHAVHGVRTVELRLPAAAGERPGDLEAEMTGLPTGRPDVRCVLVAVMPEPPPDAEALPAVAVGAWRLADLGTGTACAQRWRLSGHGDGTLAETLRRLHRVAVAEFLIGRQRAESGSYAAEIGNDLQFIEKAINKVLRFRLDGQPRTDVIAQLETNVKELSANYAKLNRNAGIFRDVVQEEERLSHLLRRSVTDLGPTAPAGGSETVFSRRLDQSEERLDESRRRERELLACLASAQTAIATQGMNIELLRSGELIELQKHTGEMLKKGVSLQAAAVLIEFVVLFAYSLHAWEMILGADAFHAVPGWLRFFAPLLFSAGLVLSAHSFADWLKEGHFPNWAYASAAAAILALGVMFAAPWIWHAHHAPLILRYSGHEYELRSGGGHDGEALDLEAAKKPEPGATGEPGEPGAAGPKGAEKH